MRKCHKKVERGGMALIIDISCEDSEDVGELEGNIGAIRQALTPSFRKPRLSPTKEESFSQEMHLEIPLSSRGLKLSNF
jgi:hypothetical protein